MRPGARRPLGTARRLAPTRPISALTATRAALTQTPKRRAKGTVVEHYQSPPMIASNALCAIIGCKTLRKSLPIANRHALPWFALKGGVGDPSTVRACGPSGGPAARQRPRSAAPATGSCPRSFIGRSGRPGRSARPVRNVAKNSGRAAGLLVGRRQLDRERTVRRRIRVMKRPRAPRLAAPSSPPGRHFQETFRTG
jgi:hypothetical protein